MWNPAVFINMKRKAYFFYSFDTTIMVQHDNGFGGEADAFS